MASKRGRQSAQLARREALSLVGAKRLERAAREKRLDVLAVSVTTALVQRRELDRLVGESLVEMTESEGLSLREAVGWCDLISMSEAQRLHADAMVRRPAPTSEGHPSDSVAE